MEKQIYPPVDFIEAVSKKYVKKDFRHRFAVEAIKKTTRLRVRLCHHIDSIFTHYLGDEETEHISPNTSCWLFTGNWEYGTWEEFATSRRRDEGIMIIPDDMSFLYAKKEFEKN